MIPIHVTAPSLRLRPLPRALPPLYSANIEQHSLRFMCTRAELIRGEEEQRRHNEPCDNCGLEVCPWGYAEYWDTRGFTRPLSPICKACDVHVRAGTEPPPCTCPHGARACEKTDSGCLLHVVPAFYRVPDGVPHLVAPYMKSFHWVGESEPDAATRVMRADERACHPGMAADAGVALLRMFPAVSARPCTGRYGAQRAIASWDAALRFS
ncbi:hypothetical protein DFH09DRAFT_1331504 [Mycena vulgaris]|nr:hypothetical protein DFH09DRAFT_1331504 [Mycena vulgaris]